MVSEHLQDGAERYETAGGVTVTRRREKVAYEGAIDPYFDRLDYCRGAILFSN